MAPFYRNVFAVVPRTRSKEVAAMLKAIHAQESAEAAMQKAELVAAKLRQMKVERAAAVVAAGVAGTVSYCAFPREHHLHLRTNNPLERVIREIRRRARVVVGNFPDGRSALMLVATRLRHVAGTRWALRRYMDMSRLRELTATEEAIQEAAMV